MIARQFSNLELQGLLIVSELELFIQAGGNLPTDVITSMTAFRRVELLETGGNNKQVRNMVAALKAEYGDSNNH